MEKDIWIENIINSTNGMTFVKPGDELFSRIQLKIQRQNKVEPKTIWLVAASIAALVALNVAVLSKKENEKENTSTVSLMESVDKSNQLYQ